MRRAWRIAWVVGVVMGGVASGQQTLTRDLGGTRVAVSAGDVRLLAEAVGLTREQASAAQDLQRAAKEEGTAMWRRQRREMIGLQTLADWRAPDGTVDRRFVEMNDRHMEEVDQHEARVLRELRSLLTPEQEAGWGGFERVRLRRLLAMAEPPGHVDLAKELASMRLSGEERESIRETIAKWEGEVDGVVSQWRALNRTLTPTELMGWAGQTPAEYAKASAELRGRLGEITRRSAHALAATLGGEKGEALSALVAVRSGSLGQASQDWRVQELFRLQGVSPEQEEGMKRLGRQADREVDRAARDYAAIEDRRARGEAVDEQELARLHAAATEVYRRITRRLFDDSFALLTPEQRRGYEDGSDPARGEEGEALWEGGWWP